MNVDISDLNVNVVEKVRFVQYAINQRMVRMMGNEIDLCIALEQCRSDLKEQKKRAEQWFEEAKENNEEAVKQEKRAEKAEAKLEKVREWRKSNSHFLKYTIADDRLAEIIGDDSDDL